MRTTTYPQYKGSGIERIGLVPTHWTIRKATWLFSIGSGTTPDSQDPSYYDGDIPWITTSELRESVIMATAKQVTRKAQVDCSSLQLHPEGSIAVAMYGATIGRLGILGVPATVNQACCVFSDPQGVIMRFWFYWLQMRRAFLVSLGYGGGQPNLSQELLRSIRAPIPTVLEQHTITDFLDRETAKIDALVEKKERLIELLREKRTALITHTVTKGLPVAAAAQAGLNPNVPMKDSGIEWLGKIPAHWKLKRLKHILSEPLKYGANEAAELNDPELPRYVRITDIDDLGGLRDETFRSLARHVAEPYLLQEGDLLLARSGATAGKTFLYGANWGECAYAGYLIRARLDQEQILPLFIRYYIASSVYWQWLSSAFIQATIQNVSAEKYAELRVPIPAINEQKAIFNLLDRETAKIDALIAKVKEAIERLKEYRTALISATVTGKIDLRNE